VLTLQTSLSQIKGIAPRFLKQFERLEIVTIKDLLWHFPFRYEDFSEVVRISELEPGQQATIQGTVESIRLKRSFRRHFAIVEAVIRDDSGTIKATWFNQPYLANTLRPGRLANFAGKATAGDDELYLSHPIYELLTKRTMPTSHTGRLVPVYPETRGLTSKAIRFLIQSVFKNLESLTEWLPRQTLAATGFPEINRALRDVHFPDTLESAFCAKKRFSFEELFLLQLLNIRQKLNLAAEQAPVIKTDIQKLKKVLGRLPFALTPSQKKSLWEIIRDLEQPRPMNRLLQGDVGSGKTVVTALAAVIAADNGYQSAFMAPTEILANQHFETLKKLFKHINAIDQPTFGLLTASKTKMIYENDLGGEVKKETFKQQVARGEIKIIIGTHSLIQKSVTFKNLGLVIVDEQHRFGVRQRLTLARGQTQTETRTDAEEILLYENITFKIRGCLFNVRKKIGLGHKESIYQKALQEELGLEGINFEKEKSIDIIYNNKRIGVYRPDFVIENKIILELKALSFTGNVEKKQLWNYLRGSSYRLALLANFGPEKLIIHRVIYDRARESQRLSASVPHFLSMSATPIPRTLMLSVFGDLDISTITELPAGRKQIITKIVAPAGRSAAYQFIREQIKKGRQAFVICPRIESADTQTDAEKTRNNAESGRRLSASGQQLSAPLWETKSVKEEYEKLSQKIFPDLRVAMLHGQMKPKEKEQIMSSFASLSRNASDEHSKTSADAAYSAEVASATKAGKALGGKSGDIKERIDILVSTSVVEVGVDIPNASIMMIEGAERFGLAQLYQFRGRVGRGEHQSFCFLFTDSSSKTTDERLQAILEAKNGFELAEKDLKIRGPGEFLGQKQTGLPDIAMRGLQDIALIQSSRAAALRIIQPDHELKKYPLLREKLDQFQKKIHPE